MKVWVIEQGDYDREAWGVADSPDSAFIALKAAHPQPPYSVHWVEPERTGETTAKIVGYFSPYIHGVQGKHEATYYLTEMEFHQKERNV